MDDIQNVSGTTQKGNNYAAGGRFDLLLRQGLAHYPWAKPNVSK